MAGKADWVPTYACEADPQTRGRAQLAYDIPFPFEPYPVQKHFMHALRHGIDVGRNSSSFVGTEGGRCVAETACPEPIAHEGGKAVSSILVMESPTGTGKTLSLLNGTLSWLQDQHSTNTRGAGESRKSITDNSFGADPTGRSFSASAARADNGAEATQVQQSSAVDDSASELPAFVLEHQRRLKESQGQEDAVSREEAIAAAAAGARRRVQKARRKRARNGAGTNAGDSDEELLVGVPGDDSNDASDDAFSDYSLDSDDSVQAMVNSVNKSRAQFNLFASSGNDENNEEKQNGLSGEGDRRCEVVHPKLFYASRTHSQLSQVIEEARKTPYFSENSQVLSVNTQRGFDRMRFAHLASRQQLCINSNAKAAARGNAERLNEVCRDLCSAKAAGSSKRGTGCRGGGELEETKLSVCTKCPYAQPKKLELLHDYCLVKNRSLEQIKQVGEKIGACPYLTTVRYNIKTAHVVFLPYAYLLDTKKMDSMIADADEDDDAATTTGGTSGVANGSRGGGKAVRGNPRSSTRAGSFLQGDIVVIDEAHNVVDATTSMLSKRLTFPQLEFALDVFGAYLEKFETRLLWKNRCRIREIVTVLQKLRNYLQLPTRANEGGCSGAGELAATPRQTHRSFTIDDFIFSVGIDNCNLYALVAFIRDADVVRRLHGFSDKYLAHGTRGAAAENTTEMSQRGKGQVSSVSATPMRGLSASQHTAATKNNNNGTNQLFHSDLYNVLGLLESLATTSNDSSTVLVTEQGTPQSVVLQLLVHDPSGPFETLTAGSSCLVLAGGTMPPQDILHQELFPSATLIPCASNNKTHTPQQQARLLESSPPSLSVDIEDLVAQASPTKSVKRRELRFHSFPHVVPHKQVLCLAVGRSPANNTMKFTFRTTGGGGSNANPGQSAGSSAATPAATWISDITSSVLNFSRIIPDGLVCFFPSHRFLQEVLAHWRSGGGMRAISEVKRVFVEDSTNPGGIDALLHQYRTHIEAAAAARRENSATGNDAHGKESSDNAAAAASGHSSSSQPTGGLGGALLLAVMGGRLSEGINFQDGLGRGVLVVGLPFPNPNDPQLRQKVEYLGRTVGSHSHPSANNDSGANNTSAVNSNDYYEMLCMRVVNQSIGRCIRHINDYATIILLDVRYTVPNGGIQNKLPAWIKPSFGVCQTFVEAFGRVRRFFIERSPPPLNSK